MDETKTITELADEHDVDRQTIRDLIKKHRLQHHPVPRNGNAKGYDARAQRIIADALTPTTVATA